MASAQKLTVKTMKGRTDGVLSSNDMNACMHVRIAKRSKYA